jgi:hypothetical protein
MIDSIAALSFDMVQQGGGAAASAGSSSAGKVSVHEVSRFEALHRAPVQNAAGDAAATQAARAPGSDGFASVLRSLQTLNGRVESLSDSATRFAADRQELTPGDMVQMTVRCHEFMFQCELTANVANRSSEGVQQLFRQQS